MKIKQNQYEKNSIITTSFYLASRILKMFFSNIRLTCPLFSLATLDILRSRLNDENLLDS